MGGSVKSVDVNVLLNAVNSRAEHHGRARGELIEMMSDSEPVVVLPTVAIGFLRLATDRRVLARPLQPVEAASFLHSMTAHRHISIEHPGPEAWEIFDDLHAAHRPVGPDVTDLYLAASAIALGATWVSFDRGFARFPELDWKSP